MQNYSPAPDLLKDRVILITGAGDGIGRAVALGCAAHGATVVLLGKTLEKLEAVYDEIEQAGGPEPAIYPLHLEGATEHDYAELAEKLQENFGRLDGLLHNAAMTPYLSRIIDWEPNDFRRTLQVNLIAPFLLTQACLPLLLEASDAALLFTSDSVGRQGKAFWGGYAASKFGLEGLSQVMADEFDYSKLRVFSIDPGPTRTEFRRRLHPGEDPASVKPPQDLVSLYLWALGPDSTGHPESSLSYPGPASQD